MKVNYIDKKIKNIRKKIASLSYTARSAHLGSSLSCVEILTACMLIKKKIKIQSMKLYFQKVMQPWLIILF